MRRKVIAGNWKMNGLLSDIEEINRIANFSEYCKSKVILCPPITLLSRLSFPLKQSSFSIGAQDCHQNDQGPHTGEISPKMLSDIGVSYVIIGHSERRETHFETNKLLKEKILAAWRNNLSTIVCVGENLDISKQSKTNSYIKEQLNETLPDQIPHDQLIIAYEPIWAIGTGEIPSLNQIEDVHSLIRNFINVKFGKTVCESVRIIYGGSLNKDNSKNIFSLTDVDGGLVGGASLTWKSFTPIISSLEDLIN